MNPVSPQFIYIVLVLPVLFGLVLIGEGINKVFHRKYIGYISLITGLFFVVIFLVAYFFLSGYLSQRV
jgi:hypothetical protein